MYTINFMWGLITGQTVYLFLGHPGIYAMQFTLTPADNTSADTLGGGKL